MVNRVGRVSRQHHIGRSRNELSNAGEQCKEQLSDRANATEGIELQAESLLVDSQWSAVTTLFQRVPPAFRNVHAVYEAVQLPTRYMRDPTEKEETRYCGVWARGQKAAAL